MAAAVTLYPPRPNDIPAGLTRPTHRYQNQMVLALLSLLLFVLVYVGLAIAAGLFTVFGTLAFGLANPILGVGAAILCGAVFLFLVKGFFKRQQRDRSPYVEIREDDQPRVFAFVQQLCDETGAPFPKKIYVSPEVNAAVFYDTSLLSLLMPS